MSELNLAQIGQIAVNVSNLESSVTFYRDVLGMNFLFEYPGLAFFDCAGVRLMLDASAGWQHPGSIIYYRVEDIQAAYQTLSDKGVNFKEKPHFVAKLPDHDLWMTFFEDPSGNILALMNEKYHV